MNRILIIAPHYPPSNLAAVHRTRLFAQHLPSFGWEPIILTVDEQYYEEKLDWDLHKLIPSSQRIVKVNAIKVGRPRLIGDIGLRAFFQLRKKAVELIKKEQIDFVYIPIPSFYTALLGPYLHKKTGIKYGIDYIDPWVHEFPGSEKLFPRHWFSTQLAKLLEPIAVKHAALITGVSEGYYLPVLNRNPHLKNNVITAAMPYGGEEGDHEYIRRQMSEIRRQTTDFRRQESDGSDQISDDRGQNFLKTSSTSSTTSTTSTSSTPSTFKFVYAGALLPKAHKPLEKIFEALASLQTPQPLQLLKLISTFPIRASHFRDLRLQPPQPLQLQFIGTLGTIKPIAEKHGLFGKTVFEHPNRMPYMDVLKELDQADGIFILGSTEPHYTPSKVYQAVLSQKPILAILHEQSSAVKVLREANAGIVITMNGEEDFDSLATLFLEGLKQFQEFQQSFNPSNINKSAFEQYSAKAVTSVLVEAIEKAILIS